MAVCDILSGRLCSEELAGDRRRSGRLCVKGLAVYDVVRVGCV